MRSKPIINMEVTDPTIGGRLAGRALFQAALELLERSTDSTTLTIHLDRVGIMDFSAADEFLAKLLRRAASGELGERRVVVAGVSPEVRETLAAVLQLRGLQCLEDQGGRGFHLLGELSPPLLETLAFLNEQRVVTARAVAESSGRQLTAITNRLSALVRAGLVLRRPDALGRQGRQFVYESILPTINRPPATHHRKRKVQRREQRVPEGEG